LTITGTGETRSNREANLVDETLFLLADKLRELREKKDEQTALLKATNAEMADVERELIGQMTDAECSSFARSGKQFVMTCTTRWSAAKENKEGLYAELKNRGYEHLFTVNAQTLTGFIKDIVREYADAHNGDERLPDWLTGLVGSYDDIGIQMRKATKK
jgi:hypothetical protein